MINPVYVLVPLSIVIVVILTLIFIGCGLKLYSGLGLSLIISVITIWVIHPFQINQDNALVPQLGDKFVAWYTVIAAILAMVAFIIAAIKTRTKSFCPCRCCQKDIDFSAQYENSGDILYSDVEPIYDNLRQTSGSDDDFFI